MKQIEGWAIVSKKTEKIGYSSVIGSFYIYKRKKDALYSIKKEDLIKVIINEKHTK